MINSGLLVCSFYLKKKFSRNDDNIIELNNKLQDDDGNVYDNIFSLYDCFLSNAEETKDDENSMKLFSIDKSTISKYVSTTYNAISFVVSSGSYGLESEITNRKTGRIKYRRTQDDADIKQFFCLIYVPKDTDEVRIQKGIFLFQTIGSYGVKTITSKQMKEFFSQKGFTLETRSVSVRLFLEKIIENSALSKVTLIKNKVSPDLSDNMFISTGREEKSYIKPKLQQSWIKRFLNVVDGKQDNEIFEIDNETYEDIRITFSLSGKSRTVAISDIDRFSVVEEIPDNIYNNGTYSNQKLTDYMLSVAESYKEKMIFRIKD